MGIWLVIGLILMVVGYFLAFVGVSMYESRVRDPKQPLWVYIMIYGGLILALIGTFLTIVRFGQEST